MLRLFGIKNFTEKQLPSFPMFVSLQNIVQVKKKSLKKMRKIIYKQKD